MSGSRRMRLDPPSIPPYDKGGRHRPSQPRTISLAERAYRSLLWLLPRGLRSGYGRDMTEAFRDLSRERHARGGGWAVAALWGWSVVRLAVCGLGARLDSLSPRRSDATVPRRQPGPRPGVGEALGRWGQEVRFAVRSYCQRPLLALTAVALVALGVGATATIFSVVDGVLLKRLPYPDPDRLVYFDQAAHPVPRYRDWKDRSRSFAAMAAAWEMAVDFTGGAEPQRLTGVLATPELLPMLGATAAAGRLFVAEDFSGMPQVAVLSHGAFERLFGADPSVIGRKITLSDSPAVVVGVLDRGFVSPSGLLGRDTDVWLPLDVTRPDLQRSGYHILEVLARLRPEVPFAAARAEMELLGEALAQENPDLYRGWKGRAVPIRIVRLQTALVGNVRHTLILLLGAVALLLTIACANVAHLLLARGAERAPEVALRYALGAGRRHLLRQLLTESTLLAVAGGVLGMAMAWGGVRAFEALNPGGIPMIERIGVDLRVLGFALGLALVTGILFGLAPAWQASRVDLHLALRDAPGGATGGRRRARLRNTLVVGEIAVTLVVLAGAGLLGHSFVRLRAVDPGFDPDRLLTVSLRLDSPPYSEVERQAFAGQLLERVEGMPGVRQATLGVNAPFLFHGRIRCCWIRDQFRTDQGEPVEVDAVVQPVAAGYFSVLGANLRGRDLGRHDHRVEPTPAVLSGDLARRLFAGGEALGRTFTMHEDRFTVIGVVSGLHFWGLDQGTTAQMYVPWQRHGVRFSYLNLVVRSDGDPQLLIPALREAVWAIAPELPIVEVFTMAERIDQSILAPRFYSALFLTFATVAVLLAAGGVYASVLYSVRQRRRELGIRTALGAHRARLLRMVVAQSARLALVGIVVGTAGALAASRALESMVFGISTTDAPTFLAVAALLGAVAIGATLVPAWRAVRANPAEVFRCE